MSTVTLFIVEFVTTRLLFVFVVLRAVTSEPAKSILAVSFGVPVYTFCIFTFSMLFTVNLFSFAFNLSIFRVSLPVPPSISKFVLFVASTSLKSSFIVSLPLPPFITFVAPIGVFALGLNSYSRL